LFWAERMLLFMSVRISKIAIGCLVFLILRCTVWPQQKVDGSDVRNSPQVFVQEFYDWYVPKALGDHANPAWDFALKYRKQAFSSELYRALKEDSDAQAKATDLVGLDFDPFLDSQDPSERYEVGSSTQEGDGYEVKVYAILSGKKSDSPDVIAELVRKDRQWKFVNFLYPDHGDLLSNLKGLRDDRASSRGSTTRTKN
jgi:Protein of unknown function (DUF3828)